MTTTHNTPAAPGIWPPPAAHDADLSDADWGAVNRELLAEKLAVAYWGDGYDFLNDYDRGDWLSVADVAIAELLGAPNA